MISSCRASTPNSSWRSVDPMDASTYAEADPIASMTGAPGARGRSRYQTSVGRAGEGDCAIRSDSPSNGSLYDRPNSPKRVVQIRELARLGRAGGDSVGDGGRRGRGG